MIETRKSRISNKLWDTIGVIIGLTRKTITKSKKMAIDLHVKLVTRHSHYYSALSCRRDDVNTTFVSPREYEFSCSNSPAYKRKLSRELYYQRDYDHRLKLAVHAAFDMFGHVSPSPPNDVAPEDRKWSNQVDKDAEEFIRKFYKELQKQRRVTAVGSPSPYHLCVR